MDSDGFGLHYTSDAKCEPETSGERKTVQLQHIAVIDLGANTTRIVVLSAVPGHAYRREAERNALPLVEQAFGRRVVLESTAAAEFC
jgi:hypothetical protein